MELENNMPEGWIDTDIGESSIVTTGFPFKSKEYSEYGKLKVVRGENVSLKKLRWNNCKYWIHSTKNLEQYFLQAGDIVVGMDGSRIGKNKASVSFSDLPLILAQRVARIRAIDGVSQQFLKYTILNKKFERYIIKIQTGTSIPHISLGQIKDFNFILPPLTEQKAIAKILTAFDDKIELLQAQNKTLETMAQTIFKEWFGKYQQELNPPNGWRTFSLSELVDTINGYSYKGKELVEESNEALVSLKSFDRNGGFQTRGFKPFKGSPKTQHEVKIGDLVVAHTDLTQDAEVLGNPAFVFDNGGFEKMYITMDLVKVISKNENIGSSFLYYLMKDRYFKGHCVGYSNGTTVLHLSKKAIPEYELYLPENFDLIKKFTKIANDTTNKISLNKDAIKSLTKTRDTLLPKLMSGQVRVNNIKNA